MKDFANYVGKSLSTVYDWKYKGFIPIIDINGKNMVDIKCFSEMKGGNLMSKRTGISIIKRKYKTKKGKIKNYEYAKMTIRKDCPTFYDYAKRLIENKVDVKPVTKEKLLTYLDNHLKRFFYDKPVNELNRDYLRYVIANCEGRSDEAKQIISTTCAELAWNDYLPKDISQGLKYTKYDKDGNKMTKRREKPMPSYEELQRFYNFMKTCNKPMTYVVLFMFCVGTNRSETLALKKSDFNFDECYADINKAYTIIKKGTCGITSTKNKYRVRRVYFPRSIIPILKKGMNSRKGEWFAGNEKGNLPVDPNNFSRRYFSEIGKKLGISVNISSHIARHVYITSAINAGVPPTEVMRQVGHRDLTMIMRVYTHYMPQSKPSEKMGNFMEDMAATVLCEADKKPKETNIITVDFTKRFA